MIKNETDELCTYFLTLLHVNNEFINQDSNQDSNHKRDIIKYCHHPRSRKEILNHIGLSNQTSDASHVIKRIGFALNLGSVAETK